MICRDECLSLPLQVGNHAALALQDSFRIVVLAAAAAMHSSCTGGGTPILVSKYMH